MTKIALVITYFGNLPFWFPAFQYSCSYNPEITWLIFSDQDTPHNCPDNVKFIRLSISEFENLVSNGLGFQVSIKPEYLYKLCDFKPAFGLIYKNYLNDFDFWGHCDIDVVWGDLLKFMSIDILDNFEIITSRIDRISGHFCLYQNTDNINSIFLSMPWTKGYLKKSHECMRLDEVFLTNYLHWLQNPPFISRAKQLFFEKPYVPRVFWHNVLTTSGEDQRKVLADKYGKLRWIQGRTYGYNGEELMYIHFHKMKDTISNIDFDYFDQPQEIYITSEGIFSK